MTVHFYKPDGWGTPNIYYYKDNTDTGPAWPGEAMGVVNKELVGDYAENWYVFKIAKYEEAKVLFNSGNNQIPVPNMEGFTATDKMWYKDGVWCDGSTDRDNDKLLDCIELMMGTNINKADTDNDGLSDGYEVNVLGTNPLLKDSDGNGISDGNEDFDEDGLNNLLEYQIGSDSVNSDTDFDKLDDYTEYKLGTNLKSKDTDNDGLDDAEEIKLGTDPLNPDSNGNEILDGDEMFLHSFTADELGTGTDDGIVPSVSVEAAAKQLGSMQMTTVENDTFLSAEIPGYITSAYNLSMDGEFDSATLSFEFNENNLNTDDFLPAIYYYDEENQILEEVSNQRINGNVISAVLDHFSKYILLNKKEFDKVWKEEIKIPTGEIPISPYIDVALAIDSSGSMDWNDSNGIRKTVAKDFVSK